MSTTAARLQLLEGHVVSSQATAQQTKNPASSNTVTDGQKKYPEIIDYHPEKKVRYKKNPR
jgi:hypothetical protein